MSEKFDPSQIGSKYGLPVEGDNAVERPNQDAFEKKRDEYIQDALAHVLKEVKENNSDKYEILETELKSERDSDDHKISDESKAILEEMVFHVVKQIYADHGGAISKDENGKDKIVDGSYLEKIESEYPDDVIEVMIVDTITETRLGEFGEVVK